MVKNHGRSIMVVLLVLLLAAPGLQGSTGGQDGGGSTVGGPTPMDAPQIWEDDFDDSSKVDTMQRVEIVSGEVRVEAGQTTGLVASEGISCPAGFRYDLLVLEVNTPGASSVKISVLNATEDSTKVGYVNEPIPGFLKQDGPEVLLTGIGANAFPEIRLQADL